MSKTIYIAGLGLIGASLGLAIKRGQPDYRVLGYNRSIESRQMALEKGCVDKVTGDFAEFAPLADIIILAVPIKQTLDFLEVLADLPLKEGVIISDAGSTKLAIVEKAEQVFAGKRVQFLAAHPMAGSHKSGAQAADVSLFENAYYIFTPSSLTADNTQAELEEALKGLRARFISVDPKEHDYVTSQISHFPHILASSLMEQAGDYALEHPMTQHFAAGGFRDMTRIAESEPGMWTSILLSNSSAITERIEDYKKRLDRVVQLIEAQDQDALWQFFHQGGQTRRNMEIHKRAGVDSFYDIFIDVPDEEDVILAIMELLRGTSLVNLRINEENREDIHGILQITFKTQEDQERAVKRIEAATDYQVHIK